MEALAGAVITAISFAIMIWIARAAIETWNVVTKKENKEE